MPDILKKSLKAGILWFTTGALFALLTPPLAAAIGVEAANPLWLGAL